MGQGAVLRAALSVPGTAQLLVLVPLQELARGGIHRTPRAHSIWGPLQHFHHSLLTICLPDKRLQGRESCGHLAYHQSLE